MFWIFSVITVIVYLLQVKLLYATCGYESCHPIKEGYINVHLIPHSHDDVGWTKTFDQYYKDPNDYDVRAILTTSYESLLRNPDRRFIYVESAFFFKWWDEQSESTKTKYKELVNNGQLEFISGGWSMNDEATTNYQSIIDQFTLGLRKLNATFGKCGRPRIGWQIDPFGHSSEMASILSQIGFDGLFLGRIDYQDKKRRMETKSLEMLWEGSDSLGSKSQIFTSVLYNTYFAPEGFSWDMWSGIRELDQYNIASKWKDFVRYINEQRTHYATNNIIITMGGDFNYMYAERYFRNLDKLIKYGNEAPDNHKYHLLYSTPSCYLKAVHDEGIVNKISWPRKTDDFFPYADEEHAYWTGYFTSRPTLKYFERLGNNFLQVCKQLSVLGNLKADNYHRLNSLKEAMGVLQHHDAVSGTEQEHVSKDYASILSKGMKECEVTSSTGLRYLTQTHQVSQTEEIEFNSCLLLNISQCEFSERSKRFIVTVYNPLSRPADLYLRLPVANSNYTVRDPEGCALVTQLVPIPKPVIQIPGRKSDASHELVFQITQVPPLGFKSYHVSKDDQKLDHKFCPVKFLHPHKQKVKLRIGRRHGLLKKIVVGGKKIPLRQEFLYYQGAPYDRYRASGAYIFRPLEDKIHRITESAEYKVYSGDVVHEVHQTFNDWVSQVVRMYHGSNFVELNWQVGPLPDDGIGREVISHFTTQLNNNGTFYTDSNCRGTLKRIRDYRPTWNMDVKEKIAGNYYPVTSNIVIKDHTRELEVAVLTDRSQGGTSSNDGEIELMVHRNTIYDDQLGVVEPLNERAFEKPLVVRGTHWVVVGNGDTMSELEKDLADKRLLSAWTFLSTTSRSYDDYKTLYNMEYSGLTSTLPNNVKILTLEPLYEIDNAILLRLEHNFEIGEHQELSRPVEVKLKDLFQAFTIVRVEETTLAGNQLLKENTRMKFASDFNTIESEMQIPSVENGFAVMLSAMQIRTFVVTVNRKEIKY